jgi:hypothetical protein
MYVMYAGQNSFSVLIFYAENYLIYKHKWYLGTGTAESNG